MCTCSTVGTGTAEACLAARQTASLRVSHDRVDERVVRHADSTGMRDFSVHCSGAQHELAVVMARQRSGAQAVLVTNGGPTLADAEKPDENSRFRVDTIDGNLRVLECIAASSDIEVVGFSR